jgi:arylsulfatase A
MAAGWGMRTLLFFLFGFVAVAAARDEKPNVVLFFCDDLGYADISCFGSEVHNTPNIDMLAEGGTKFMDFYVTSGVCTPSRSSLMTGCYPRRTNMHFGDGQAWVLFPGNHKGLNPDEITVAEILKDQGYATGIVGKWHLGDQREFLPTRQGFDSYFGIPYSNDMGHLPKPRNNYPQTPLLIDEEVIEAEPDQRVLTRRYTDQAVKFIKQNHERPFFLYFPQSFPHWPHYASEAFLGGSRNGVYGDCIEEVDWSVGQVMATLKALDLEKDTLVIFTSDNGGRTAKNEASNAPLRAGKGTTWEGGQRVCCIMKWPGKIPEGRSDDTMITSMDILPTVAKLAGAEAPTDRVIDGKDIRPILFGEKGAVTPHEAFYYYYTSHLECVRSGKWKLRMQETRNKKAAPGVQLYDLEADIGETKDVAAAHPDIVEKLQALAEKARLDLGDGDQEGANQRAAGYVENAVTLLPRPK